MTIEVDKLLNQPYRGLVIHENCTLRQVVSLNSQHKDYSYRLKIVSGVVFFMQLRLSGCVSNDLLPLHRYTSQALFSMRLSIPLSLSCLLEGLVLVHYITYTPACENDLLLNVPVECDKSPMIDRMT